MESIIPICFWKRKVRYFKIDSRTSDAIALAMRCGCPVYTTDEIMESEQLHEVGEYGIFLSM